MRLDDQATHIIKREISEAATRGFLYKKVLLNISQNSNKNACVIVSFLNKVTSLSLNF